MEDAVEMWLVMNGSIEAIKVHTQTKNKVYWRTTGMKQYERNCNKKSHLGGVFLTWGEARYRLVELYRKKLARMQAALKIEECLMEHARTMEPPEGVAR